jgi:Flp pilus assembly protein TadD
MGTRLDPRTESRIHEAGIEFLVGVLREETLLHPNNTEALAELAALLTKIGRHEEGLDADLRLTDLQPRNPVVFYNLACSYSLLGRVDDAFRALRRSVELGYEDDGLLLRDPDLASIRRDPRFREIVSTLQSRTSR